MILLSILIPTLKEREHHLQNMKRLLQPQLTDEVQVIYDDRGREITTGQKRNDLVTNASGKYTVFVDDDDWIDHHYVYLILRAIKDHNFPDCITFNGWYTEDKGPRIDFVIKLGENYEARNGKVYRWPNHLCPMKREIALKQPFPNKTVGEDYEWSKAIRDRGLLKTSVHIERDLYYYDYRSRK